MVKFEQVLQHVWPLLQNYAWNESVLNAVVLFEVAQRPET